jgi:hypothetical protein
MSSRHVTANITAHTDNLPEIPAPDVGGEITTRIWCEADEWQYEVIDERPPRLALRGRCFNLENALRSAAASLTMIQVDK